MRGGGLISSHCSKRAALSSYRDLLFEKRALHMTGERVGEGKGEVGEEVKRLLGEPVEVWRNLLI